MIPILYESTEKDFTTNGLGRLKDAITCNVIEERNGTYELDMTYPITGIHYNDIQNDRIIYAMPADGKSPQPFRIYKISRPITGQVTVYAEHISYLLATAVAMPFKAESIVSAFAQLQGNIVGADFEFWTDKSTEGTFNLEKPTEVRTLLGGTTGSILDVYGTGEYEFDKFTVKLHLHRGHDNGVTIRYGKNMSDLTHESDMTNVYTGIIPYCTDKNSSDEEYSVVLPEKVVKSEHTGDYGYPLYKVVDFSSTKNDDGNVLSVDELRKVAEEYVKNNEGWEIAENITVSFEELWLTEEYKDIAPLERVNLCDTVHVIYTDLGVNAALKVTKTDFNVLSERYNSIELGESTNNLAKTLDSAIKDSTSEVEDELNDFPSRMQEAIKNATNLITGGLGGYVYTVLNADGEPEEILFMDSKDKETAVNVLRINKNGIGFSKSGYNGPYESAWTLDGKFVADFITSGTLDANIIKAGIITDAKGSFYLDMVSGELKMKNGTLEQMDIVSGTDDGEKIVIKEGAITGYKNGSQQARLEITNGAFNIIGRLQINGREGVSGSLSSVSSITVENHELVDSVTVGGVSWNVMTGGSITDGKYLSGGSVHASTATITYVTNATYGWTSTATFVTSVTYSPPSLSGSVTWSPTTTSVWIPSSISPHKVTVSEVHVNTETHSYAYGLMMN